MTRDSKSLEKRLADLLNHYSRETASDTPDSILARYMLDCLAAYERATIAREGWYGRRPLAAGIQLAKEVDYSDPPF